MDRLNKYKLQKINQSSFQFPKIENFGPSNGRVNLNPSKQIFMTFLKKQDQTEPHSQNSQPEKLLTQKNQTVSDLQQRVFLQSKINKSKQRCLEKRKMSFKNQPFENMIVKLSQAIIKMIKFRKNENWFYLSTLQRLNINTRDPGNKKNRIALLMVWILSWIKVIFKVTQSKIENYFKK